jgi:hypothetical protein
MREVLQNFVDRVPVIGEVPAIEEAMSFEVDGVLTATYPRIDMRFLRWRCGTIDGISLPQFAVFGLERPVFAFEYDRVDSLPNSEARIMFHSSDRFLHEGIQRMFVDCEDQLEVWEKKQKGRNEYDHRRLWVRYSGLMPKELRDEVLKVRKARVGQILVIGEVTSDSWKSRVVTYEDPLVVLVRDSNYWLIGWYDLTAGEDHVLGTMTASS